jgi:hypothetical protein
MNNNSFPKEELAALVRESVRDALIAALAPTDVLPAASERPHQSSDLQKRIGRRKSRYQGQLHLTVLPEDQEWFNLLFRNVGIQKGMLFSLLRSCFEHIEATGEIDLILEKFNLRTIPDSQK